jgi:hypothetical protein
VKLFMLCAALCDVNLPVELTGWATLARAGKKSNAPDEP